MLADRDTALASEPDGRRRPHRGITENRKLIETASQELARLRAEKLRRQALLAAAEMPLPPDPNAAHALDARTGPRSHPVASVASSQGSAQCEESSATAWVSARSSSGAYRDASSNVDGGSDSDADEQTSALTPLRTDQHEAARAVEPPPCGRSAETVLQASLPDNAMADEKEWSPGDDAVAPPRRSQPRHLQRISKGGRHTIQTPARPTDAGQTGPLVVSLEDSSDDDWAIAASASGAAEDSKKPLLRLRKAGGSGAQPDKMAPRTGGQPPVEDDADALGDAMSSLTVRLPQILSIVPAGTC